MRKVAILDLDTKRDTDGYPGGIMIANNERRAEAARGYAQMFEVSEHTNRFYERMFDAKLVYLDQIEENVHTFLTMIDISDFEILLLTSRPHTMKSETERWLARNNIHYRCYYKPYGTGKAGQDGQIDNGERFTKTAVWKARIVKSILDGEMLKGEPVDSLIFADDEEANRAAIAEIGDERVTVYGDLQEAAQAANEQR